MTFPPFMYYSDGPRVEVSTDGDGVVYAALALAGDGLFADVREPVAVGRICEGDGRDDAPYLIRTEYGTWGYGDARAAAAALVDLHHEAQGYGDDDDGGEA
jgi:hypothetical protein